MLTTRTLALCCAAVVICSGTARPQDDDAPAPEPATEAPADPFAGKGTFDWDRGRKAILREGGSSKRLKAIHAGIDWLARHQHEDGRWSGAEFASHCVDGECEAAGRPEYDVGLTGLSLLALLGAGEPQDSGAHAEVVKRGLNFLKGEQDDDGYFGRTSGSHWMYGHMIATLAMVEAYGMTGSDVYRASAEKGVKGVLAAQNPYLAWRYGVRDGDNDTSLTVWGMLVLRVASRAGIEVDERAFSGGIAWINLQTEPEFGRVGYQTRGGQSSRIDGTQDDFDPEFNETLTGMGVLGRCLAGANPMRDDYVRKGVALLREKPLHWSDVNGTVDFYGWQFCSLAMFQVGGTGWRLWSKQLDKQLLPNQKRGETSCARGSWFAPDAWTDEGGRVYSTAMSVLALEAHARYPRFGSKR